jgi:hypothetical protein
MGIFLVLQLVFNAVLLFGIIFLFHYLTQNTRKKAEEQDLLGNLQVQEVRESLQDLLTTLKQLGQEVSDGIKDQVESAEVKTAALRDTLDRLEADLERAKVLSGEVGEERRHLEEKATVLKAVKGTLFKNQKDSEAGKGLDGLSLQTSPDPVPGPKGGNPVGVTGVGFSSSAVREVYRLADQEKGIPEIARRTKLTRAEIQLILNLRGNRFSASN